jgi:hypothetical protein
MIDFTTIDANPIPPSILTLQKENARLLKKHTQLKNVAKMAVGFAFICLTALLIEKQKTMKNAEHKQQYN